MTLMQSDDSLACLLRCGNSTVGGSRGLCVKCYGAAQRQVYAGETTWAELVKDGKALAAQKPGAGWRKYPLGGVEDKGRDMRW